MATKKISELTALTVPDGAEELVVNDGGTSKKVRLDAITEFGLSDIDTSISDTATAVFVYDTSKDSDGGQWRKRTQATSWYNETLNTSTRGSRKEFPAVAVIVAESDTVTIYDGDDPDLPMWMVFDGNASMLYSSATSVYMLNGTMAIGLNLYCVLKFDFLIDGMGRYRANQQYAGWKLPSRLIADRDITHTGTQADSAAFPSLVNDNANDIAMTVLPNAPIDPATGLPIPTIAVATDGGVSVIKDDGSVVDDTYTIDGNVGSTTIVFNDTGYTMGARAVSGNNHYAVRRYAIPSSDTSVLGTDFWYDDPRTGSASIGLSYAPINSYVTKVEKNAIGSVTNLTLLKENPTTPSEGSVAYITSDYNTGWMNGDIKLAALSDTDDTDVTGSELVSNGTFDSGVSGWTADSGTPSYYATDSSMKIVQNIGVGFVYQAISTVVGKTYTLSLDAKGGNTNSVGFFVGSTYNGGTIISQSGVVVSSSSYTTLTGTFTATTTTTYIRVSPWASVNNYAYFDNISVRLAEPDRSVNGNGLAVHGTIDKDPVATGADLVAYSGFATQVNTITQPYNSDLDFGTGDFCVMAWVKGGGDGQAILIRERPDIDSHGSFLVFQSSGNFYWYLRGQDTIWNSVNSGVAYTDTWQHVCMVRQNGMLKGYVNGKPAGTPAAVAFDISYPTACLSVGCRHINTGTQDYTGSVSLVRISATVPTAEQMAKIYNDEKPLFQEGAKATLYDTSDAVTALAHDDDTDLLHVGTSAGRSVFQGLRRVDNTTDAVGTCISASNDLVVEE